MGTVHVLVINPNSTKSMTHALKDSVESQSYPKLRISFFTAESGPASINNDEDAAASFEHCKPLLSDDLMNEFDAFVVACYSAHPLVPYIHQQIERLKTRVAPSRRQRKVVGIFEASVRRSLELIKADEKYGIVSTGVYWEDALTKGVQIMDVEGAEARFAGVTTTGLIATELHDQPEVEVRTRIKDATQRLLRREQVGAICLGCAAMAGMDKTISDACVEELGQSAGANIHIVDGVSAALHLIEKMFKQ